ncbi:hypothetical protein ACSBR1_012810 [Camellia fascicularis]
MNIDSGCLPFIDALLLKGRSTEGAKKALRKRFTKRKNGGMGMFFTKLSYIKDYDGGILMECIIEPKLPYTDLSTMVRRQRQAIDEKIRELSNCHIVYPGIDFQNKEAGIPKKIVKVEDIPGLREAGWTPDQWGHSRFKTVIASVDSASRHKNLTLFMRSLLKAMHDHPDAWPFKEPVDARDVPDYYDIIKDPMDLKTMSKRVESEQYYVTFEMFVADVKRMFGWKPISLAKFNRVFNLASKSSIDKFQLVEHNRSYFVLRSLGTLHFFCSMLM